MLIPDYLEEAENCFCDDLKSLIIGWLEPTLNCQILTSKVVEAVYSATTELMLKDRRVFNTTDDFSSIEGNSFSIDIRDSHNEDLKGHLD